MGFGEGKEKRQVGEAAPYEAQNIAHQCPHCTKQSTFGSMRQMSEQRIFVSGADGVARAETYTMLQCSNPKCREVVFFYIDENSDSITCYPPITIDFDDTDIPPQIASHMGEAIVCFREDCYVACAIMIRRVLEELCADQSAGGENLKKRIENLESKITVPKALIEALTNIRLLGNDAAHVVAKDYEKVGVDECAAAIEITKEFLKSVYQMGALTAKLAALKKT